MPEAALLPVTLSEHARLAINTLGQEDRRIVSAWMDHLRNWNNDEFVRSHSRLLEDMESVYVLNTNTDLRIAFSIEDGTITVLSIFRKEWLESFQAMMEQQQS